MLKLKHFIHFAPGKALDGLTVKYGNDYQFLAGTEEFKDLCEHFDYGSIVPSDDDQTQTVAYPAEIRGNNVIYFPDLDFDAPFYPAAEDVNTQLLQALDDGLQSLEDLREPSEIIAQPSKLGGGLGVQIRKERLEKLFKLWEVK